MTTDTKAGSRTRQRGILRCVVTSMVLCIVLVGGPEIVGSENSPGEGAEVSIDPTGLNAVRDVADHEWDLPTPSVEWNVKEVVAHVVLGEAHLPMVLSGDTTTTQT